MKAIFRVSNEYTGVCRFCPDDLKNVEMSEEDAKKIPSVPLIRAIPGSYDALSRHGLKKGDPVELEFDDTWSIISVRKPGEERFIWKRENVPVSAPKAPIQPIGGSGKTHQIVHIDIRLDVDVTSIFIGLQRAKIAFVNWDEALRTGREICIPCRQCGWQNLSGRIVQILQLQDGRLIVMKPTFGSLLQSWPDCWIWVPTNWWACAGVLNKAPSQHHKFAALTQALRGTTITVGQAIDNGWLRF